MAEYVVSDTNLTAVANAIRAKTGGSAQLEFPDEFVSEIGSISGGSNFNFAGTSGRMWGSMAKALVDGTYKSGHFTLTTAFPNTWSTLLDTGLTELHGFCGWMQSMYSGKSGQACCGYVIFSVNEDETLNYYSFVRPTASTADNTSCGRARVPYTQETSIDGNGMQGALRLNGGVIEYKGRYNQNANYQIFPTNVTIEWLAW